MTDASARKAPVPPVGPAAEAGSRISTWSRAKARLDEPLLPLAVGLAAVALLLYRRPETILIAQFANEDGTFYADALLGRPLWLPYAGYLQLAPRLILSFSALWPIPVAPLIAAIVALVVQGAVAAYLASDALRDVMPDRRLRLAVAALFVLLPAADELVGRAYNVQWVLAIWMAAAALANRIGAVGRVGLVVAGLSGPFSILFAPIYWLRGWRTRQWIPTAIVTATGAIQAVMLLLVGRDDSSRPGLELAAQAAVLRVGVQPFVGARHLNEAITAGVPLSIGVMFAAAIALLLALAARPLPRWPALVVVYAGAVVALSGLAFTNDSARTLLNGWSASRYFLPWALAVGAVALAAAARRHPAGLGLAALLLVAVVSDFRLLVPPDEHWEARSACLAGAAPCVVPIPWPWAIYWPGRT